MGIIDLIESAIEDEQEAQRKYAGAAASAKDPEVKAFFEQMAREERAHERRLRERLIAIKLLQGE
ncbi:MAG: rubrerythrin [Actinobacteria bacterium]|nr:rubrerythrin [Actinomycetota bacterium]